MLLLPAAMAIMLDSRLGPVLGGGIQFPPRPFERIGLRPRTLGA